MIDAMDFDRALSREELFHAEVFHTDLFHAALDAQPWASYTHAYGSAEDVPGCLRALAGDDDAAAEEAQSELYGSILHQGSVYEASAKAVPFLARIAAAGIRTADALLLIGGIAEGGTDPDPGPNPGPDPAGSGAVRESDEVACRRAVVAQLPLLLASVEHQDRAVRQAAAWAAGWTGTAGAALAVPALRDRAAIETDPLVRAELLTSLVELDPESSASAAAGAVGPDSPPELRIAAVMAGADIGLPWTRDHHEAVLDLLPLDRLAADRYDHSRNEPLHDICLTLLDRDTEAVFALLDAALRSADPEARTEAVWVATTACELSRSAPARLAPALISAAAEDGPDDETGALSALGRLGPSGAPAADLLAARAAGDGDTADRALEALVAVDPVRAASLLARGLEWRPRALQAASGGLADSLPVVPYDPELLVAVRRRLATMEPGGTTPFRLTALLASWGPDASDAVPELLTALPAHPRVLPKALVAVCPPGRRAEVADALRARAGTGPAGERIEAARALHELTGDHGPLLPLLAERLAGSAGGGGGSAEPIREAAEAAAAVGPAAVSLVPALRAALNSPGAERNNPQMDDDIALAVALHRITGDAAEAVPVLAGVLGDRDGLWRRWTLVRAAAAAGSFGPAARPLVPVLKALLGDHRQTPSAALALRAVAPDDLDAGHVAGLLLDAAEAGTDPFAAVDALVAFGTDALSDEHRARLTELGERDRRVVRSGLDGTVEITDEQLRARVRAAVRGE
ncbi:HEAT repeat domain-containing protein [Streptomyces sp. wa1064]|uniref:HEAT repeat domain-containing protein n=1 Tax=Streptomyces sp. wa1064 TaxID=1828213 RepID=UPI003C7BB7F5